MEHFSHEHSLVLSKYNSSPRDALCRACHDPISSNTSAYHCIHRSISPQKSPCTHFFLHKKCADLPMMIQHHLHAEHMLTLSQNAWLNCNVCDKSLSQWFVYECTRKCFFAVCLKCAFLERELNHPSHKHTLTLLPLKGSHMCIACGMEGTKDFSYLCQTCFFWIHKSCASAPAELTRKDHHNDHPLVLAYSLPKEYQSFGVSCSLCPEKVYPFYWLYYCAGCRYFAHVQCALSASNSARDGNEISNEDAEGSNLVNLPVSENQPYSFHHLIEQFAKKFTTYNEISKCHNGHSLTFFKNFRDKNFVDEGICDGCVQPLSPPHNTFCGCLNCKFFLHDVCATALPREFQHASYPENKLTKCYQISKPFQFYLCNLCGIYCNGILYSDKSNPFWVDIVCASLPSKLKHDSHRHTLQLSSSPFQNCKGCAFHIFRSSFGCEFCDYYIHINCALKPGKIKHRWDEHQLVLMYPPVKGHPHAFNCELCSEDINPNFWFYHCDPCDTSFHTFCADKGHYSNIKYGGIVKYDGLHEHGLELTGTRMNFKCGDCGRDRIVHYKWEPCLKCASCKFLVCMTCIQRRSYGTVQVL
ncbi:hypothetical protein ACET3Z_031240 [Daucus carota]